MDRLRLLAARLQHRLFPRGLRTAEVPGLTAFQPDGHAGRRPPPLVQHGGQLHDQHQLAVLWGRGNDEPSHPDDRPGGPELRVCRGRNGNGGCPHPGHFAAEGSDDRQLLGRSHPLHDPDPPPPVTPGRHRTGEPGGHSELRGLHGGPDGGSRSRTTHPGRPGGEPDRHQAAGHQWRRLLQRQLSSSVRELDPAEQLRRDVVHPGDPVRLRLHLW